MTWFLVAALVVVAYLAIGAKLRKSDLRVTASVTIHPDGSTAIDFLPAPTDATVLPHLLLTYGAKLRWILLSEPPEVQRAFRELTAEAIDHWSAPVGQLLRQMPTAVHLLGVQDARHTAGQPESFVVKFYRTEYRHLRNKSSVWTTLPAPGLAFNLVWHYMLLLDAVHQRLDRHLRLVTLDALRAWWDALFSDQNPGSSLGDLAAVTNAADAAWYRAWRTAHGSAA